MFKDAQYMSAKEKENVWENFKRIIDKRDITLLKKPLYRHLHVHCSFIAHYNIFGFKEEYSGQNFRAFVQHFDRNYPYNRFPYVNFYWVDDSEYGDINMAMVDYATEHAPQIYRELDNAQKEQEIALVYALAKKHNLTKNLIEKPGKPEQCNIFDMVANA